MEKYSIQPISKSLQMQNNTLEQNNKKHVELINELKNKIHIWKECVEVLKLQYNALREKVEILDCMSIEKGYKEQYIILKQQKQACVSNFAFRLLNANKRLMCYNQEYGRDKQKLSQEYQDLEKQYEDLHPIRSMEEIAQQLKINKISISNLMVEQNKKELERRCNEVLARTIKFNIQEENKAWSKMFSRELGYDGLPQWYLDFAKLNSKTDNMTSKQENKPLFNYDGQLINENYGLKLVNESILQTQQNLQRRVEKLTQSMQIDNI